MLKTLKKWLLIGLFVTSTGAAVYLPISQHVIIYQSSVHVVAKDHYGWDQTYINLDKEPLKWRFVLQSPKMRGYFMKHYQQQALKQLQKQGNTLWNTFKKNATATFKKIKKKSKDTLNKLQKDTQKSLRHLGQKGKKMLKQTK